MENGTLQYFASSRSAVFSGAEETCREQNGTLARPDSPEMINMYNTEQFVPKGFYWVPMMKLDWFIGRTRVTTTLCPTPFTRREMESKMAWHDDGETAVDLADNARFWAHTCTHECFMVTKYSTTTNGYIDDLSLIHI